MMYECMMYRCMKYRKLILSIVFILVGTAVWAMSPIEAFLQMPDALLPFLSNEQRNMIGNELVVATRENDTTVLQPVTNRFGTTSLPLELTDKTLRIQITEGVEYDWLIEGDKIILVQTVCAPQCASVVSEYDQTWQWVREIKPTVEGVFVRAYIERDCLRWKEETSWEEVY